MWDAWIDPANPPSRACACVVAMGKPDLKVEMIMVAAKVAKIAMDTRGHAHGHLHTHSILTEAAVSCGVRFSSLRPSSASGTAASPSWAQTTLIVGGFGGELERARSALSCSLSSNRTTTSPSTTSPPTPLRPWPGCQAQRGKPDMDVVMLD